MIRKVFIIIYSLIAISCLAQNKTTLIQHINEIKTQNDIYYWDQYTHPNGDSAKINATKRLLLDVNFDRGDNPHLTVAEIMPSAKYINIDRGNLKQYFVYIKKTEALALNGGSGYVQATNAPVAVTPAYTTPYIAPITPEPKTFIPEAFVQRVMETRDFQNIYKLLKSFQSQGQILQFGKLKDVEDYSSLDLILFDMQSQQVITMLSAETASGTRVNMVSGLEDSLNNYPTEMTAVIWYIKK